MELKEYPDDSIEYKVVEVIKTCYDPEIPVNIYELGLIYDVTADVEGKVAVSMTLTSPACPVAGTLPGEVQRKIIDGVEEITDANVDVTWDPPWSVDMMSEAAKLQLGMM
ncbi:MAG: iron-sulfur cluster assembly protein [Candidatus Latescibacterota bacterium]|nr:iron-sulfur cluster assembly protein [Candidatus Latescibacterota bacterium]